MKTHWQVDFEPIGKRRPAAPSTSLLEAARQSDIKVQPPSDTLLTGKRLQVAGSLPHNPTQPRHHGRPGRNPTPQPPRTPSWS